MCPDGAKAAAGVDRVFNSLGFARLHIWFPGPMKPARCDERNLSAHLTQLRDGDARRFALLQETGHFSCCPCFLTPIPFGAPL